MIEIITVFLCLISYSYAIDTAFGKDTSGKDFQQATAIVSACAVAMSILGYALTYLLVVCIRRMRPNQPAVVKVVDEEATERRVQEVLQTASVMGGGMPGQVASMMGGPRATASTMGGMSQRQSMMGGGMGMQSNMGMGGGPMGMQQSNMGMGGMPGMGGQSNMGMGMGMQPSQMGMGQDPMMGGGMGQQW
ncbi:unnamed protein product [Dimorphilus gyrociliatus]|uniref:Uncharacterized protein n=1 Tax=Dimorphilus gyrociliatus TaxID=2664684 RepID=A0A7I8VZV8_9ANNE|nr:unnamed protein product [Dimorphilus gyrociliatus]